MHVVVDRTKVSGGLRASHSCLTGNPWSKRVDSKGPYIRRLSSWCRDSAAIWGADRKYARPAGKVLKKRWFGRLSPFLCCPEKWSGLNRISYTHWVKICDDHKGQINLRAKRKYEVLSATFQILLCNANNFIYY